MTREGPSVLPQLSSTPPPVPDAPVLDEFLAVSLDRSSGTVTVSGELDRESAHHLLDALDALRATPHRTWSVDASQVVFCDAAGLRALAAAQALATRHGRELRVVACS